jgi:acetolactate synthase I/II/III large subunit
VAVTAHIKEHSAYFHRFDVLWTPTVLILDANGIERARNEGYLPNSEFRAQLEMGLARIVFMHTCIISNGFASMGIALPGAIGAKLLYPDRRVLAACGDGGFLMSVQELETAVRAGMHFVVLIFEDSAYGVIKWKQLKRYGRPAFVDFRNPNFAALAGSFGCRGYRVTAAQELQPMLEEAFQQRVPAVVTCPVDYGENLRLTEKLGAWVCP